MDEPDSEGRVVRDELGSVTVPADAYWGSHTQRAVENFPISSARFDGPYLWALALVKRECARANAELGHLDEDVAAAVVAAAEEVMAGEHDDQFPVDVYQTGSGTSTNMNANEVLANRASELLGGEVGSGRVHPNDHVNFGQSSNDVIPTATHVAALVVVEKELLPALGTLADALDERAEAFDDVVKTGRTHLQDAIPVRLGQEFAGYRTQIEKGRERVEGSREHLRELALGGNQTGTGLNCPDRLPELVAEGLTEETGIRFVEAENHFEAQAAHDAIDEAHGALRTVAGSMTKIATDLRLLASGPRNGLGELEQPTNQPGSSITPGKINPVVAEAVNQVHATVVGNDVAVAVAAGRGELEISLYKPMLAHTYLDSAALLANAAETFAERFVAKLSANREHCARQVERGIALATALNPHIGYEKTSEVAKAAMSEGKTIRAVVVEKGYLSEAEADRVLDAGRMTEGGIQEG